MDTIITCNLFPSLYKHRFPVLKYAFAEDQTHS